jgi:hypothetical protein
MGGGHVLSKNFLGLEGRRSKGADGETNVNIHSRDAVRVDGRSKRTRLDKSTDFAGAERIQDIP